MLRGMVAGVAEHSEITALLGPTNTGKTHRAVERMLQHRSGMIGLPLRLLARELYDRISAQVGEHATALVTGEEKRIPARPRYWVCTVESMPLDRTVDFMAVDEIQLCGHTQRGHVFTDRMLRARGRLETWFMGAATMRPLMQKLVPTADIQRHPRLSKLQAVGKLGLSALPPRSAVIAFSANQVYELADKLRRRRGGAAVVLGALSPRTRNAQVAMYQAGEVDFIVATDAIGMGLNIDVDHVAFAALHKFDGFVRRMLTAAELAQIAGRAGRHTRAGSFGTLSPVVLPDELAYAIESHRFVAERRARWRNSELQFSSILSLIRSLAKRPPRPQLMMVERADDAAVLEVLANRARVMALARGAARVEQLWEVCCIPDFRRILPEHHANLLEELFVQLCHPRGHISADFMHQRIARLESDQGDIDELMMRMETIRMWNYISYRSHWVVDSEMWQARTQRAEDALSRALHERLVDRFVERAQKHGRPRQGRSRQRKSQRGPVVEALPSGPFAQLQRLRDKLAATHETQPSEQDGWVNAVVDASHAQFTIDGYARVRFDDGKVVARLIGGQDRLRPGVRLELEGEPGRGGRARLLRRMRAYAQDVVAEVLGPLGDSEYKHMQGPMRGLAYQLRQGLGAAPLSAVRPQLELLDEAARQRWRQRGMVIGRRFVFYARGVVPPLVGARLALCHAFYGKPLALADVAQGAVVTPAKHKLSDEQYWALGYARYGSVALRLDVVEQLDDALRSAPAKPTTQQAPCQDVIPHQPPSHTQGLAPSALFEAVFSRLHLSPKEFDSLTRAFGYRLTPDGYRPNKKRRRRRARRKPSLSHE